MELSGMGERAMKKLAYIPFVADVVLFAYMVAFVTVPEGTFISGFLDYGWGNLNMQYILPAIWIALLVSLIVPFVKVRIWVRIATPLLAIGSIVLSIVFWSRFRYP
jgi:hypothetical protein